MSFEAITEHRGRSRHRQIATLSGLTSTGRVRKGTRGKPHHGCIFCGKVTLATLAFGQESPLTRLGLHSSRTLEVVRVCYLKSSQHTDGSTRRHQGKHKRGAYPCIAPGCTCTFHNPALLERHKRHEYVRCQRVLF